MSKSKFVAIRNQAGSDVLELFFLDAIYDTYDYWSGMIYSKVQEIIDKVNYYKPSKIKVVIDSEGGDAQTGLSIYNFLVRCDAKIEVEIIGLAGSIASVIAMAANKGKLKIARNAFMMIHKAEGVVGGTSQEIRQGADLVDLYTSQIVDIYSQRTGKTAEEINKLIENGDYWMAGEDCVAQGFADETFNDVTPNIQIAARLDTTVYKNIPAQIRAQMKPGNESSFTQTLNEMKKFWTDLGTNILNAIKGVQAPANNDHPTLMNSIGLAVSNSFTAQSEAMETSMRDLVNETIASKPVNDAIALQVTNATKDLKPTIDFNSPEVKTAIENATKAAVTAALNFETDGPLKTAFDLAVTAAVKKETAELQQEIAIIKGKPSNTPSNSGGEPIPIGQWK